MAHNRCGCPPLRRVDVRSQGGRLFGRQLHGLSFDHRAFRRVLGRFFDKRFRRKAEFDAMNFGKRRSAAMLATNHVWPQRMQRTERPVTPSEDGSIW